LFLELIRKNRSALIQFKDFQSVGPGNVIFSNKNLSKPSFFIDANTAILKHKLWLEGFKKKVKEEKNPDFKSHRSIKTLKKSPSLSFEQQKQEIEKFFGSSEEKNHEERENPEVFIDFLNKRDKKY